MSLRRLSVGGFGVLVAVAGASAGCGGGSGASASGTGASTGSGPSGSSGTKASVAASAAASGATGSTAASGGGASSAASSTGAGTGGASAAASSGSGTGGGGAGLNPNAPPGTNFDLSLWELQEPVGSPGAPTTISPAMLAGGYHDTYFYTDPSDGAMTFWDPENGVTTANSNYPRSELREMTAGGTGANWAVAGTNTLSATVAVVEVPDHVCIGQIHIGTAIQAGLAASTKPLLELYYHANGDVVLGIEDSPSGNQTTHTITNVALGTKLGYVIQLSGSGTITLSIDGTPSTFTMPASFAGYGMYFKAGDYDQTAGTSATVGAKVKFYALQVSHGP